MKPIVVHFYTWREDVYEGAKPKPGGNVLPDWFHQLEGYSPHDKKALKNSEATLNVRTCPGIVGALTHSVVVPMWCDFRLTTNGENCLYQYADEISNATFHNPAHLRGFYDVDKVQHIKLSAPWLVKCDEDIKWLMSDCVWHRDNHTEYTLPPGVVNLKHTREMHLNLFFHKSRDEERFLIEYQQPIVQYVPLNERPVQVRTHLVNHQDYINAQTSKPQRLSFLGGYEKLLSGVKSKWS